MGGDDLIRAEDLAGLGGLRMDVVRFGVQVLPPLRALDFTARKALLLICSEYSLREPLHLHFKRDLRLPGWSTPTLLTGAEVVALMAFGLFVQMGSDERACAPLIEMFPEILAAARATARRAAAANAEAQEQARQRAVAATPLFAALLG